MELINFCKFISNNKRYNSVINEKRLESICELTKLDGMQLLNEVLNLLEHTSECYGEQSVEISKLKSKVKSLTAENILLKSSKLVTSNELRLKRMANGNTTYNHGASKELVMMYKQQGMSNDEIAKELGVSIATVWRRIKEYKKLELKDLEI